MLCNKDGTTSPIAENDGERRKKIHHLTTVELATFFLLGFHLEFFLKKKRKKGRHYNIYIETESKLKKKHGG